MTRDSMVQERKEVGTEVDRPKEVRCELALRTTVHTQSRKRHDKVHVTQTCACAYVYSHMRTSVTTLVSLPRPPHRSLENGKVNPNTISWADARSSSENPQCTSYAKIRHDRIGVPHMRTSVTTLVSPPRPPHPSKMGRSTPSFLGGRGGFGELAPKSVETADTAEASLERCAARSNCG